MKRTRTQSPGIEARYNEDGTLDEVVAAGKIHIEQMDTGAWWIGITTTDGKTHHVNLWAKRQSTTAIHGRCELDV